MKMHFETPEGYLSINDVAYLLPSNSDSLIHRRKNVYNLLKRKDRPDTKKIDGRTFFVKLSFEKWLKAR